MAWIHFKMAIRYQKTGKKDSADLYFKKAESELKETIDYDMYSDFAYRHLGVVYEKWGKTDLAKSQYDIVIALQPDHARTCIEIAQDCEEAELYDTAVDFYQKALNANPKMEYAAFRLAYLYVKTKRNLKDAMIFAETAIDKDSANFNYIGVKGIINYAMNDFQNAKIFLEKAIQLQQGYTDREARIHYYFLGLVYKSLNQKQKSVDFFKEYLKNDPYGEYAEDAGKRIKM
jgi:tetratricopeptide (TPR) repeat protein